MKITKKAVLGLVKAKRRDTTSLFAKQMLQELYDQLDSVFDNEEGD